MVIKESNVTISVRDLNVSVEFYKKLGLELKNRWGPHYAQLAAAGVVIGLRPAEEPSAAGSQVSIGFMVDEIEEAKKLLESHGISYTSSEKKPGRRIHFNDPDGTNLFFTQREWSR